MQKILKSIANVFLLIVALVVIPQKAFGWGWDPIGSTDIERNAGRSNVKSFEIRSGFPTDPLLDDEDNSKIVVPTGKSRNAAYMLDGCIKPSDVPSLVTYTSPKMSPKLKISYDCYDAKAFWSEGAATQDTRLVKATKEFLACTDYDNTKQYSFRSGLKFTAGQICKLWALYFKDSSCATIFKSAYTRPFRICSAPIISNVDYSGKALGECDKVEGNIDNVEICAKIADFGDGGKPASSCLITVGSIGSFTGSYNSDDKTCCVTINNRSRGATYSFNVKVTNSRGASVTTANSSFTTLAACDKITKGPKISGLTVSDITQTGATFEIKSYLQDSTGATFSLDGNYSGKYTVTGGGKTFVFSSSGIGNDVYQGKATGLSAGTTYTVKYTLTGPSGSLKASATFTTLGGQEGAPSLSITPADNATCGTYPNCNFRGNFTITLKDFTGAPMAGKIVGLMMTDYSGYGDEVSTDANGRANVLLTNFSDKSRSYTLKATYGSASATYKIDVASACANCKAPTPVCGNGSIETGEQCEVGKTDCSKFGTNYKCNTDTCKCIQTPATQYYISSFGPSSATFACSKSAATGKYIISGYFFAVIRNSSNQGFAPDGVTVKFSLSGGTWTQTVKTSGGQGQARFYITNLVHPGSYTFEANLVDYPSAPSFKATINTADYCSATPPTTGQISGLSLISPSCDPVTGNLKATGVFAQYKEGITGITGKVIDFSKNSLYFASATTGADGKVSRSWSLVFPYGKATSLRAALSTNNTVYQEVSINPTEYGCKPATPPANNYQFDLKVESTTKCNEKKFTITAKCISATGCTGGTLDYAIALPDQATIVTSVNGVEKLVKEISFALPKSSASPTQISFIVRFVNGTYEIGNIGNIALYTSIGEEFFEEETAEEEINGGFKTITPTSLLIDCAAATPTNNYQFDLKAENTAKCNEKKFTITAKCINATGCLGGKMEYALNPDFKSIITFIDSSRKLGSIISLKLPTAPNGTSQVSFTVRFANGTYKIGEIGQISLYSIVGNESVEEGVVEEETETEEMTEEETAEEEANGGFRTITPTSLTIDCEAPPPTYGTIKVDTTISDAGGCTANVIHKITCENTGKPCNGQTASGLLFSYQLNGAKGVTYSGDTSFKVTTDAKGQSVSKYIGNLQSNTSKSISYKILCNKSDACKQDTSISAGSKFVYGNIAGQPIWGSDAFAFTSCGGVMPDKCQEYSNAELSIKCLAATNATCNSAVFKYWPTSKTKVFGDNPTIKEIFAAGTGKLISSVKWVAANPPYYQIDISGFSLSDGNELSFKLPKYISLGSHSAAYKESMGTASGKINHSNGSYNTNYFSVINAFLEPCCGNTVCDADKGETIANCGDCKVAQYTLKAWMANVDCLNTQTGQYMADIKSQVFDRNGKIVQNAEPTFNVGSSKFKGVEHANSTNDYISTLFGLVNENPSASVSVSFSGATAIVEPSIEALNCKGAQLSLTINADYKNCSADGKLANAQFSANLRESVSGKKVSGAYLQLGYALPGSDPVSYTTFGPTDSNGNASIGISLPVADYAGKVAVIKYGDKAQVRYDLKPVLDICPPVSEVAPRLEMYLGQNDKAETRFVSTNSANPEILLNEFTIIAKNADIDLKKLIMHFEAKDKNGNSKNVITLASAAYLEIDGVRYGGSTFTNITNGATATFQDMLAVLKKDQDKTVKIIVELKRLGDGLQDGDSFRAVMGFDPGNIVAYKSGTQTPISWVAGSGKAIDGNWKTFKAAAVGQPVITPNFSDIRCIDGKNFSARVNVNLKNANGTAISGAYIKYKVPGVDFTSVFYNFASFKVATDGNGNTYFTLGASISDFADKSILFDYSNTQAALPFAEIKQECDKWQAGIISLSVSLGEPDCKPALALAGQVAADINVSLSKDGKPVSGASVYCTGPSSAPSTYIYSLTTNSSGQAAVKLFTQPISQLLSYKVICTFRDGATNKTHSGEASTAVIYDACQGAGREIPICGSEGQPLPTLAGATCCEGLTLVNGICRKTALNPCDNLEWKANTWKSTQPGYMANERCINGGVFTVEYSGNECKRYHAHPLGEVPNNKNMDLAIEAGKKTFATEQEAINYALDIKGKYYTPNKIDCDCYNKVAVFGRSYLNSSRKLVVEYYSNYTAKLLPGNSYLNHAKVSTSKEMVKKAIDTDTKFLHDQCQGANEQSDVCGKEGQEPSPTNDCCDGYTKVWEGSKFICRDFDKEVAKTCKYDVKCGKGGNYVAFTCPEHQDEKRDDLFVDIKLGDRTVAINSVCIGESDCPRVYDSLGSKGGAFKYTMFVNSNGGTGGIDLDKSDKIIRTGSFDTIDCSCADVGETKATNKPCCKDLVSDSDNKCCEKKLLNTNDPNKTKCMFPSMQPLEKPAGVSVELLNAATGGKGSTMKAKIVGAKAGTYNTYKPQFILYPCDNKSIAIEMGRAATVNSDGSYTFNPNYLFLSKSGFCVGARIYVNGKVVDSAKDTPFK